MLLQKDGEEATALHFACLQGSRLIPFIVEQARRLNLLDHVLHCVDEQGRTPLFRLCQQGFYRKNNDGVYKEHALRHKYIEQLILNPQFGGKSPAGKSHHVLATQTF